MIRTFDSKAKLVKLQEPEAPRDVRDYRTETPATEAEFAIYKRMYVYDPLPLNADDQTRIQWLQRARSMVLS